MDRILDFISRNKVKVAVGVFILFLVFLIRGAVGNWQAERNQKETETEYEDDDVYYEDDIEYDENEIEYLQGQQDELVRRYGELPDGFIWDMEGNLLSLGDPNKSAEESLYAYLNAVASLDIGTVQRYSRNSYVVSRYSEYFNSSENEPDYTTQFMRNMYRECMLSLQVESVLSTSVFAENRVVFTVECNILDLTSKDFWEDDKWEIFDNLHIYSLESDSTKSDMYLYDYILNYYRSGKAALRKAVFDITLERYSDVNSGWLVSIDSDIDDACVYRDGTLVVNYIKECYNDEGVARYESEEESRSESEADAREQQEASEESQYDTENTGITTPDTENAGNTGTEQGNISQTDPPIVWDVLE